MIVFPKAFVKIHHPGYFWNVDEHALYTMKVTGVLRPLKLTTQWDSRINRYATNGVQGYRLSVSGEKVFSPKSMFMHLKKPWPWHTETVDQTTQGTLL